MKELVAYITAGFPDKNFTIDVVHALKNAGVDKLELGIPFSDPVADGPIIEEANLQTLHSGFKMQTLFDISEAVGKEIETYWMGYFNPFYHKGLEFFSQKAQTYGIKGYIIPDLPYEESTAYTPLFNQYGLHTVSFVAPTDSPDRIATVVKNAQGFIYLVAYAGITGSAQNEDLTQTIQSVKEQSKTPLFVGFGVNEKTAKQRANGVDGVIVGSAFVEVLLDTALSHSQKIQTIARRAANIKDAINA
ncbi:MAG: tryptophan synthase subunit alpha [Sulfurospirillaceae bacterium]|nr:tryptophan synthase subunit alpha [Sulfurospirillaceae bacterium]